MENTAKIEVIPNRWYPIEETRKVRTKPVPITRFGLRLVVFRGEDGGVRCFADRCPHRGVALSLGRVAGNGLECKYHGFRFDGDGRCTSMPCEGPDAKIPNGMEVDRFAVVERHGLVWLWWGASAEALGLDALPDVPWFDELPESSSSAYGMAVDWPINHVRSIESNFDIHHGAFVHGSVLPGIGTQVRDMKIVEDGERFDLTGELLKPGKDKGMQLRVKFAFPSMSLVYLTDSIRFIVADCPIDAHRTWRYARYYNDWVAWPVVGKLIAWALVYFEWKIVQNRQDLPVVSTQTPKHHEAGCDKLVRADMGTGRYLSLRRKILREEAKRRHLLPPHVLATTPDPDAKPRRALPIVYAAAG